MYRIDDTYRRYIDPIHDTYRRYIDPIHDTYRRYIDPIHDTYRRYIDPIHDTYRRYIDPIHDTYRRYIDLIHDTYRDTYRIIYSIKHIAETVIKTQLTNTCIVSCMFATLANVQLYILIMLPEDESQRIKFTLEDDPLILVRCTDATRSRTRSRLGCQRRVRRPQHFNCHSSFPASFVTELH